MFFFLYIIKTPLLIYCLYVVFVIKLDQFFSLFSSLFLQVQLFQSSNKRNSNLKSIFAQGKAIKFYYNDSDYEKIIRAYIDAVTSNLFSLIFHSILIWIFSITSLIPYINILDLIAFKCDYTNF